MGVTPRKEERENGRLNAALDFVLGDNIEGGYANNPADPGGETNFGICKRSHPNVDIKNLTKDCAKAIYARDYWPPSMAMSYRMPYPWWPSTELVNQGMGTAVKVLQEALVIRVVCRRTPWTVVSAPQTIEALRPADPLWLATDMIFLCLNRYMGLKTWGNFGKGWARRMVLLYDQIRSA